MSRNLATLAHGAALLASLVVLPPPAWGTPRPRPAVVEERSVDVAHLAEALQALAAEARKAHKRVLVSFQATWCKPCRVVHRVFERETNRSTFEGWVLVPVDVDALPPGPILGMDFDRIPFFIKLDESGKPSGTLDGYRMGDLRRPAEVDQAFRNFLGA